MGNRYRCAGSASETYINNERVYDRVDVKSPNQPTYASWIITFTELNGLMYMSWFHVPGSNYWDVYSFDGDKFTKFASFTEPVIDIIAFNNALYGMADDKFYRIDGTSLTYIADLPSKAYGFFVLGSYLYLLSAGGAIGETSYIYRFTGSGWTQVLSTNTYISNPAVCLYNGAIHIMCYDTFSSGIYNTHLIFNGSTLTNGAELPGKIEPHAAYVVNNKLRVFRKLTEQDSGTDVYELSGNTWSENTALNFDGWVNKRALFGVFLNAFYYKGEQYLLDIMDSLIIKVTNPIKMGQYFISS